MSLRVFEYEIPYNVLLRPAESAPDTGTGTRKGLLLQDVADNRAEIAPLPGFSMESLDEAIAFLRTHHRRVSEHLSRQTVDRFLQPGTAPSILETLPSVRFGLSMLFEQQRARKAGLSLSGWFIACCHGNARPDAGSPASNAILPEAGPEQTLHNARQAIAKGYRVLKLKLSPSHEKACEIVEMLLYNLPQATLRLDANRQFDVKQALAFQQCLNRLVASAQEREVPCGIIEYVEEPVKTPGPEVFQMLRKSGMRVAVDESARTAQLLRPYIQSNAVDAVVIKPMLTGSFQELCDMIFLTLGRGDASRLRPDVFNARQQTPAQPNRPTVTVSSSLETSVGRTLLAHLATFVNCWQEGVHGLSTGHLLKDNLQLPPGRIESSHDSRSMLRRIL